MPRRFAAGRRLKRKRGTSLRSSSSSGPLANLLGIAGAGIGGYFGGPTGAAFGASLGKGAGALIKKVTGFGDYTVSKNVLMGMPGDPPSVENIHSGPGMVLRHREYLGDIYTSPTVGAFKLDSFPVNPGVSKTFPWGSTIARNFEEYTLEGVIFEFKSTSSDALNSTNTALGTVIMSTDYDSADSTFSDKYQMLQNHFTNSCKPSMSCMHPIECAKGVTTLTQRYVRGDVVPTGTDIRLADWCHFQIATQGFQAANVQIGELWVTYQIALYKPQDAAVIPADRFVRSGVTNALPLGTTITNDISTNTLGCTLDSSTVLAFPQHRARGRFYVNVRWHAATGATITYPLLTLTNRVVKNVPGWTDQPNAQHSPGSGTASINKAAVGYYIDITSPRAAITFGTAGVLPTDLVEIEIHEVPFGFGSM